MQGAHVAEIERNWPQFHSRVRLLGDFLPTPPYVLSDPYGEPDLVFDQVFMRLRTAVENLAARIQARQSGS